MLREVNIKQFSKFSSRKSPFVNTIVGKLSKEFLTNLGKDRGFLNNCLQQKTIDQRLSEASTNPS